MKEEVITLDKFKPREYQIPLINALEKDGFRRIIAVMPRRSGKDITAFNIAIRQCLKKVGTVFYVFPTFSQGRRIIWDAIQNDGMRILDYIPKQLVESRNEQQMRIRFVNGSVLQIIGSDNYDNTLVGTNPMGVIFSEFALTDPRAYQFVRPILTANGGWCFIQSTPRGRNSFWELFKIAQDNPQSWFHYIKTVDETKHISVDEIQKEIASGEISEDLAMQEYWCSFDMGVEGSYYAKYIDKMRLEGRIDYVAWEPAFPVHTAWDIGVRDSTSIVFFQAIGTSVRIIDYYEKSKEGLEHYVKIVKDKPYLYGKHIAPHDIAVKEFGSGMTRLEKAMNLGIDFTISNRLSIEDGIEAVRSNLPKIFIDKVKCDRVIKALENYRQEFDSKKKVYKQTPLHNEWSHCCFVADTKVLTRIGMRRIIDVVDNEEVLTANGWEKCLGARITRKNASVVQVVFADGATVKCTPDHLFLTENGWISAENLLYGSMILSSKTLKSKNSINSYTKGMDKNTTFIILEKDFIGLSGAWHMVRFLKGVIFTIKTAIQKTISFLILFVCQLLSIVLCRDRISKELVKKPEMLQSNGMGVNLEENGIVIMQKDKDLEGHLLESMGNAYFVTKKRNYYREKTIPKSSATQTAKHLMVVKVERIEGLYDVWCINVPNAGHFSLENGAIVSNCDAIRYMCVSLPKVKDGMTKEDIAKMRNEAMHGSQSNIPDFFRTNNSFPLNNSFP